MKTKIIIALLLAATLHAQPLTGSASEQLEWQRREIQRMQDDLQRQRLAQQRAAMEAQRQADEAARRADEAARRAARQRAPQVSVPVRPPAVQLDTEGRAWLAAFIRRVQADPRLDAESKRRIIDDTLRRAGY